MVKLHNTLFIYVIEATEHLINFIFFCGSKKQILLPPNYKHLWLEHLKSR